MYQEWYAAKTHAAQLDSDDEQSQEPAPKKDKKEGTKRELSLLILVSQINMNCFLAFVQGKCVTSLYCTSSQHCLAGVAPASVGQRLGRVLDGLEMCAGQLYELDLKKIELQHKLDTRKMEMEHECEMARIRLEERKLNFQEEKLCAERSRWQGGWAERRRVHARHQRHALQLKKVLLSSEFRVEMFSSSFISRNCL